MILVSENTTARDGANVQSTVRLDIEAIGVRERPFFVQVSVNHAPQYHSFTHTEEEAKVRRDRMHAAYVDCHRA